jgi:hypothetical protein
MRIFGSHTSCPATEHQKEIRKTNIVVSKMIRARDEECITWELFWGLEAVKKLANVHIQLLLRILLIYTVES